MVGDVLRGFERAFVFQVTVISVARKIWFRPRKTLAEVWWAGKASTRKYYCILYRATQNGNPRHAVRRRSRGEGRTHQRVIRNGGKPVLLDQR